VRLRRSGPQASDEPGNPDDGQVVYDATRSAAGSRRRPGFKGDECGRQRAVSSARDGVGRARRSDRQRCWSCGILRRQPSMPATGCGSPAPLREQTGHACIPEDATRPDAGCWSCHQRGCVRLIGGDAERGAACAGDCRRAGVGGCADAGGVPGCRCSGCHRCGRVASCGAGRCGGLVGAAPPCARCTYQ